MDDTTWGASSLLLGQHDTTSLTSKVGYYTGTAASIGAGMLYGSTWTKGAVYGGKLLSYGCRIAKTAFTSTKTLSQTNAVVKTANRLPVAQIVHKTLFKETAVKATKKGRDHLVADLSAEGAHTVFKRSPLTNQITHYETYIPQTNSFNPNPWQFVKRYDCAPNKIGEKVTQHYNKVVKKSFPEPHIHDPLCPGGIRDALPWEKPKEYKFYW